MRWLGLAGVLALAACTNTIRDPDFSDGHTDLPVGETDAAPLSQQECLALTTEGACNAEPSCTPFRGTRLNRAQECTENGLFLACTSAELDCADPEWTQLGPDGECYWLGSLCDLPGWDRFGETFPDCTYDDFEGVPRCE